MNEEPVKSVKRRVRSAKSKTEPRKPDHAEVSERAYFIYLEEGEGDELGHWLRAERELTAA